MERKTGFEPAAFSLARRCSTTELLPLAMHDYAITPRIRADCDVRDNIVDAIRSLIRHLDEKFAEVSSVHQIR